MNLTLDRNKTYSEKEKTFLIDYRQREIKKIQLKLMLMQDKAKNMKKKSMRLNEEILYLVEETE